MKKISLVVIWSLSLMVLLSACKKDEDPAETTEVETGGLTMHLHGYLGGTDSEYEVYGYNAVYTSSAGRKIIPQMMQMYLSNIQLIRMDGSVYEIPDTIILHKIGIESYYIAEVPAGNYKAIKFHVGLDATENALDPSSYANGVLDQSNMWMNTSAQPDGYVFVNFKGKIDTTAAMEAADADLVPFNYRIGTNAHYTEVSMTHAITVEPDRTAYVHMIADYMKLFNGVDLRTNSNLTVTTAADNGNAIVTTITNNIPSMFSFEE